MDDSTIELFDSETLELADTDHFLTEYANIAKFKNKKCYIKTRFHKQFSALVAARRQNLDEKLDYLIGLQGMGKTTALIYFVLECLKRNEKDIHYIDLDVMTEDLDKIKSLAENDACISKGCLIIDHHTPDNIALLNEIMNIFRKKSKIILIEMGYAASIHPCSYELPKSLQLTEGEFTHIWNVSTRIRSTEDTAPLLGKGRDVYTFIKGRYILSPKLLRFMLDQMLYGRSLADAFVMYEINQRNKIQEFNILDDEVCSKFCSHSRALVHYIPEKGEFIFPAHVRTELFIAVNIFEVTNCLVSNNDLKNDARLKDLNLDEGEEYIRVCHLVPEVAVHWRRKLPSDIKHVMAMIEDPALAIMLQYGGAHKHFVNLLVCFQQEQKMAIYPNAVDTTVFKASNTDYDVKIENHCSAFVGMCSGSFVHSLQDEMANNQPEFQKVEINVEKHAIFMKNHIMNHEGQTLLIRLGGLRGIDYFLYIPNKVRNTELVECSSSKRPKFQNILYLMHVSTGAKHNGEIIGRSLDVIKRILSEVNVFIHVVIVTSMKGDSYKLQKCYFENISVINLYKHKELFEKNCVLYEFIKKLAEKS